MSIVKNIIRKFIDSLNVDDYLVETDTGWEEISQVNKTIKYDTWQIKTSKRALKAADTHILFDENFNEKFLNEFVVGDKIVTKEGIELVTEVKSLNKKVNMYDLGVNSENHRYYTNDFLSHNSTTLAIFLAWYTCFHNDKTSAIAANKESVAKEIFKKSLTIFENMPQFLKPGIVELSKTFIEFDNGSRVLSSATSESGISGYTVNCLQSDTKIIVRNNNKEQDIKISALYDDIIQNEIKTQNRLYKDNCKYEVLTENGFKEFKGITKTERKDNIKITFSDKSFITCTPEHKIKLHNNEFIEAKHLNIKDKTSTGLYVIAIEENVKCNDDFYYDLINVDEGNEYISENVTSHNCLLIDEVALINSNLFEAFYSSMEPTVSADPNGKIIMISTPKGINHWYYIWKDALEGKSGFKAFKVEWDEVPGRDEEWKKQKIKEVGEEVFKQEYQCLVGDTIVELKNKITGEIRKVSYNDLYYDESYK